MQDDREGATLGQQRQNAEAVSAEVSADKALDHAWRYFTLHAQQRISVFNFFVVLSGIIATGIGAGLQAGKPMAPVVLSLGLLLALFSFVFYKLDQRGSQLVKLSEQVVIDAELKCMPVYAQVMRIESGAPNKAEVWTFGKSFRLIFSILGLLGIVAVCVSLFRIFA